MVIVAPCSVLGADGSALDIAVDGDVAGFVVAVDFGIFHGADVEVVHAAIGVDASAVTVAVADQRRG